MPELMTLYIHKDDWPDDPKESVLKRILKTAKKIAIGVLHLGKKVNTEYFPPVTEIYDAENNSTDSREPLSDQMRKRADKFHRKHR